MNLPTSSKCAVLTEFGNPLQLQEYPMPTTLAPGSVLVRVEMAGICGTDVHLWKGQLPIQLPVILGHETVGIIVATGPGAVTDWTGQPVGPGDRITWNSTLSCGQCYYCRVKRQPTRCPARRAYGIGYRCDSAPHLLGGYSQYHLLYPGATLFKLEASLSTERVVGAGCALITAIHGLERAGVEWQDQVIIQGAGPVGLAALAVARSMGAGRVLMVGGPAARLEMARRFGADEVLDIEVEPDPARRVAWAKQRTGGYGADLVVECVGHPGVVAEGWEMCRDGGRYLVLGHYCDAGAAPLNPHVITRKQLSVFGSWSSEPRHLRMALELLRTQGDRFPFEALITHRFGLEAAQQALETTAGWVSTKTVLVPNPQKTV